MYTQNNISERATAEKVWRKFLFAVYVRAPFKDGNHGSFRPSRRPQLPANPDQDGSNTSQKKIAL